jgi:hypothetical protein
MIMKILDEKIYSMIDEKIYSVLTDHDKWTKNLIENYQKIQISLWYDII